MGKRVPEKSKKRRKAPAKASKNRRDDYAKVASRWYRYQHSWRKAQETLKKQRTEAKNQGTFFLEPEAKVALVIRVRGINRMSPKVRKVMRLLRLRQLHNAVLIKMNM